VLLALLGPAEGWLPYLVMLHPLALLLQPLLLWLPPGGSGLDLPAAHSPAPHPQPGYAYFT
jgi:hypothetical protein